MLYHVQEKNKLFEINVSDFVADYNIIICSLHGLCRLCVAAVLWINLSPYCFAFAHNILILLVSWVLALSSSGGDPTDILDVNTTNEGEVLPIIRKKEREYMGMFEYDRRDEMQIIRVLVYGRYTI